jgi:HK97 family phage prohead protease
MPAEAQPTQLELSGKYLQGFATRYWKPHVYDGRIEAFAPGAFARTLATKAAIRFLIGHDESRLIATAADRLELFSDETGLAFRLSLLDTDSEFVDAVKSGQRDAMSVGYRVEHDEMRTIDGQEVRIIRDCTLFEISAVHRGAVKEAFCTVVDSSMCSTLAADCKAGRLLSDGSQRAVMTSLRDLRDIL